MKKLILIFCCFLIFTFKSNAQSYSEDNKKFIFRNTAYEIKTIDVEDQLGSKAIINIFKCKNEENNLYKSIEIPNTRYDADMIFFGNYIDKEKKYILILDRYSFYILNLYNNKLLGPFSPKFYGIGQDAQSGMITDLHIIYDGRFIAGYCVDDGCFLFDLTNLYMAKEVIPATNPLCSANRVYILKQLDNKENQFGILLTSESWKTSTQFLFKDKVIETKSHSYLFNLTEEEKEVYVSDFPYSYQKYTVLKELLPENDFQFLVFDNHTGKLINLPDSFKKSSEKKINEYLKSM